MEKNILLTIAYDGTDFHGWQRQPDKPTIQGHLEKVLSGLLNAEVCLNGTSRTDAGVHALGQRASFKADINIPTEKIALVVNNALCAGEKGAFALSPIRIISAEEKPADFHARFNCKNKKYIYKIKNTDQIDVFNRNHVYHVDKHLDCEAMKKAARALEGTHDFKSFEAAGGQERKSTVRTIFKLDIMRDADENGVSCGNENSDLEIHVLGDGFLYNMVRIITGTLIDIGLGKIDAEAITAIIADKDRATAGHTAPPYGLYLAEVYY